MSKNSADEMERIRRGLEAYLADEEEIAAYSADGKRRTQSTGTGRERSSSGTRRAASGSDRTASGTNRRTSAGSSASYRASDNNNSRNNSKNSDRTGRNNSKSNTAKNTNSRATSNSPKRKKRKKKKSGWKRFLMVLLMLVLIAVGVWYYAVSHFYGKMNFAGDGTANNGVNTGTAGNDTDGAGSGASGGTGVNTEPMKEDGVINILLIGNDSREQGTDGRSDAMILLSLSSKTKTIHLTSLLRDMYVEIPGHGGNRLNAAYAYGGADLLMETLEENLDIHVNRYVLVNFQAFANVVDAVGGVDLELTAKEIEYVNGYLVEYNMLEGRPEGTDYLEQTEGGMVHLNGPQALSYCRNRLIGTDFGRTERQRKVILAIIEKAPTALLTNFTELVDSILPNLTTNLTEKECRSLTLQVPAALGYDIIQGSIPIEGSYKNATIRGMSVLEVDFEANKDYLRTSLYQR